MPRRLVGTCPDAWCAGAQTHGGHVFRCLVGKCPDASRRQVANAQTPGEQVDLICLCTEEFHHQWAETLCSNGLRGWTQVPPAQAAWVQIPQVSFCEGRCCAPNGKLTMSSNLVVCNAACERSAQGADPAQGGRGRACIKASTRSAIANILKLMKTKSFQVAMAAGQWQKPPERENIFKFRRAFLRNVNF